VCQASQYQDNIQVLAYVLGQIPQQAKETHLAFATAVEEGGPDSFHALKSVVETQYAAMSLPELLSFLRLSGWDAAVFADCLPYLKEQIAHSSPVWYGDVANALQKIQERYLPLQIYDGLLVEIENLIDSLI
jgi:hypothetical protein